MTARVVGGRDERWEWKAVSEVRSVICDMIGEVGGASSIQDAEIDSAQVAQVFCRALEGEMRTA